MRSCKKLPPCLTEPVPDGSKMDLPLAKAKPVTDSSRASVITYLRRAKTCCGRAVERGVRLCEKITLQTPKSVKKEEDKVLQTPEQRFSPAAFDKDHGEAGCPSAVHRGPRWSRSPPVAHGRPHAGAGGCPKEVVTLWGARAGAGFWQDLWTHGGRCPC